MMSLAARFVINKRELTAFEEFMTDDLQNEIEKSYAHALNRLCRLCVNSIKRQLGRSKDPDDKGLLYAGIIHSPQKVKRIMQLNPMRAVVGAGSTRKRHPNRSLLIGRPFLVRLKNGSGKNSVGVIAQRTTETVHVDADDATSLKRYKGRTWTSHQSFDGYRNTALPITVISHIHLNDRQKTKFRYMVEEYMAENHDKIVEQEYKKAVERAAKKR